MEKRRNHIHSLEKEQVRIYNGNDTQLCLIVKDT